MHQHHPIRPNHIIIARELPTATVPQENLARNDTSRGCGREIAARAKLRRSTHRKLSLSGDEILKSRTTTAEVRRPLFSFAFTFSPILLCSTSVAPDVLLSPFPDVFVPAPYHNLHTAQKYLMSGDQEKSTSTGAEQAPNPPALPQYPPQPFPGGPYPPPPGAYTWYYPPPADPNGDPNAPPPGPYVMFPPPGIMYGYPPPPAPAQGKSHLFPRVCHTPA